MASFNGFDLGMIEVMNTHVAPKGRQINAYPGVDGLEPLDMGNRGAETSVRGVFAAADLFSMGALLGGMYGLQADGGQYVLVDEYGTFWVDVILVDFRPIGPVYLTGDPNYGVVKRYEAEFLHVDGYGPA